MKKLIDFGVVTFDSEYNKEDTRFHVRAEVDLVVSSFYPSSTSTKKVNEAKCNCRLEISHSGRRIESGNCFGTILRHSELKNNAKFQALYQIYKLKGSPISDQNAKKINELWNSL